MSASPRVRFTVSDKVRVRVMVRCFRPNKCRAKDLNQNLRLVFLRSDHRDVNHRFWIPVYPKAVVVIAGEDSAVMTPRPKPHAVCQRRQELCLPTILSRVLMLAVIQDGTVTRWRTSHIVRVRVRVRMRVRI